MNATAIDIIKFIPYYAILNQNPIQKINIQCKHKTYQKF